MSNLWKWIVVGAVLGGIGGYMSSSKAQDVWSVPNFNNSIMNFNNSASNFNNSPMNFNNSPSNFNNSPMNFNATNGVYDPNGNRIGYTTVSPQGIVNIFSNDGNRMGYVPSTPLVPLQVGK